MTAEIDQPVRPPDWRVAATAAVLVAVTTSVLVDWPAAAVAAPVLALLSAAAVVDAHTRRLPDALTLPAAALAAVGYAALAIATDGPWLRAGVGAAAFAGFLLVLGLFGGGVGFGDVKAAAPAGAVLAWESWGAWFSGIITGLVLLAAAAAVQWLRFGATPRSLPYGPALVVGVLAALALPPA